nr:PD-(D/E)XK nuclease family protein [Armatimonas sp.]
MSDTTNPTPEPEPTMEERLRAYFDENYEALCLEGGHLLAAPVRESAFQQVLLYWRKLQEIAQKVTETEVKLTLADQKTPKGRTFAIEGVVDIVREDDRTIMYDLKTHDASSVRANIDKYAPQLNVYAHIWQELRGNPLDETAIISTVPPPALREALFNGNTVRADKELLAWEPVISIPFDQSKMEETVAAFGEVVDKIEDHLFAPPPVAVLEATASGQRTTFGTNVCRNCDARFSCSAYRRYALRSGGTATRTFRQYYQDLTTDQERDNYLTAGLSPTASPDDWNDL